MANLSQRLWLWLFPAPKSLTEKLAIAAERVPRLVKKGEHPNFNYLRIADVADAFWVEVRKQGLLIIPNDLESGFLDANNAWVKTQFVVTDGTQAMEFVSFGQGFSHEGHALHIAQSTALKSWLKRLGMTFGEEDDQEVSVSPYTPPQYEVDGVKRFQERVWAAALKNSGLKAEHVLTNLAEAFGHPVTEEEITSLPPERFEVAVKLVKNENLAEAMEVSIRAAKAKKNGKVQPIVKELDKAAPDEIASA